MIEKCKSCGTIFEVDDKFLTENVKWFKCGVCNNRWDLTSTLTENSEKTQTGLNEFDKVKNELASIKSVVEDKSKILANKTNTALDQKNKSVAKIASELSLSKLNETKSDKTTNLENRSDKKSSKKLNIFPLITIFLVLLLSLGIFFRSLLVSYSYLYFPNYSINYSKKINELLSKIDLPVLSETKYLVLKNFAATFQNQKVRFTGIIKNNSNRPILTPRIKILLIREDRKIILEKILILEEKIIPPDSEINLNKLVKSQINHNEENVSVKANFIKKFFD